VRDPPQRHPDRATVEHQAVNVEALIDHSLAVAARVRERHHQRQHFEIARDDHVGVGPKIAQPPRQRISADHRDDAPQESAALGAAENVAIGRRRAGEAATLEPEQLDLATARAQHAQAFGHGWVRQFVGEVGDAHGARARLSRRCNRTWNRRSRGSHCRTANAAARN
jgi:hypothetical protein